MRQELWLSPEGKVMIGDRELPRCRVLSIGPQDERRDIPVIFEVEVEGLDIQFRAAGLNKEAVSPPTTEKAEET